MTKFIKQEFEVFTKEETATILNQRIKDSFQNEKFNDLLVMNDETTPEEWKPILAMVEKRLDPIVQEYFKSFMGLFKYQMSKVSHLGFISDADGSFTENHYDEEAIIYKGTLIMRPLIVLIYINSGYSGGEIVFPLEKFVGKTDEGSIVLFPSGFPFPHLSTPAIGARKHLCRVTYSLNLKCYTTDRME